MPNWSEGTMKIRGPIDNVINYISEAFVYIDSRGNKIKTTQMVNVSENFSDLYTITLKPDERELQKKVDGLYIEGTTRGFIDETRFSLDFWREGEELIVEIQNFKQAWKVDAQEYVWLSKKNEVDLKIFAFEKGSEFTQIIEIIKGKITIDLKQKYINYNWEVPFNGLGG